MRKQKIILTKNKLVLRDLELLKKIENVKKEDRKYVIKEAEIVVSNYIKRIEDNLADRKIDRLKKSDEILYEITGLAGRSIFTENAEVYAEPVYACASGVFYDNSAYDYGWFIGKSG